MITLNAYAPALPLKYKVIAYAQTGFILTTICKIAYNAVKHSKIPVHVLKIAIRMGLNVFAITGDMTHYKEVMYIANNALIIALEDANFIRIILYANVRTKILYLI
mmetsp:Transcript_34370/g.6184  ORF Transcript_34370/g.6184 Transcript_34370/m.6184 type:complete len:106 (-) Transcript_34370:132-449(-)